MERARDADGPRGDMIARYLGCRLCIVMCVAVARPAVATAQSIPLTLGPLTVAVPAGWVGQTNAVPVRILSPNSNAQQFVSVEFFPPEQTSQDVRAHHVAVWEIMTARTRLAGPPQSGTLGQFIWTRAEVLHPSGQRESLILFSAKTGSSYLAIEANALPAAIASRDLAAIEAMLTGATLSGGAVTSNPAGPPPDGRNSAAPESGAGNRATLGEYVYATPPGWSSNQYPDGIVLTSPVSATGERCLISLWPMRSAGASLQDDADHIFQDVFKTYEPRSQTSRGTPLSPSVIRGTSGQGWDYLIVKRGIGKAATAAGSFATLLGFVMVAKLDDRLAVISGMSKDPLVSSCLGELAANAWPRFFYSLRFKSWTSTAHAPAVPSKLVGVWTIATATAADQFTFAANGRYAGAAAAQTYSRVSSTEVLETTSAFFGNGAYSLTENTLTLTPDDKARAPENASFRVEEETRDGGRSWAEALYLLRTSTVDGKDYEARYKRQ
jgi:hypothetical protein